MARTYQQTGSVASIDASSYCGGGADNNSANMLRAASSGGAAASTGQTVSLSSGGTTAELGVWWDVAVSTGTSWDAGDWVVRYNITTGNMDVDLQEVYICRVNASSVSQATIGSTTGLALGTTAGVLSVTITGAAQTPSADDNVRITSVWSNNSSMTADSIIILADQLIDSPFTTLAGGTVIPVMMNSYRQRRI